MSGGHAHGAYDNRDAVRAVLISALALGIAAAVELTAAVLSRSAGVLAEAARQARSQAEADGPEAGG